MSASTKPICILDDDSSVLNSLRELLASEGFEAETFCDPDEFLTYAKSHPVKVAILDVWLLTTSGIEVQEQLQELSPETEVIMITGREERAIRTVALQNGALDFLSKPFDDEVFLRLIRDALCDARP